MWDLEKELNDGLNNDVDVIVEDKESNKNSFSYYTADLSRQEVVKKDVELELFRECEDINWEVNLALFNSKEGLRFLEEQIEYFEEKKSSIWLMFYDLVELKGSNKNSIQRFKQFKDDLKVWQKDYELHRETVQAELLNVRFETIFLVKAAEVKQDKAIQKRINRLIKQKNKIVQSNLKLVIRIAKKYPKQFGFCDLIQEGNIGLIKGVDKFRWDKGHKLSTYVSYWIRQSINDALTTKSRTIKLPGNVVNVLYKIRQLNGEMDTASMTIEEIADKIDVSVDKVRYVMDINQEMLSVDSSGNNTQQSGDKETSLLEILEDDSIENNQETIKFEEERRDFLEKYLVESLTEREWFVLSNRIGFYDDDIKTLEEVGKKLTTAKGLAKRETVRQIEIKALEKLRKSEFAEELKSFLYY